MVGCSKQMAAAPLEDKCSTRSRVAAVGMMEGGVEAAIRGKPITAEANGAGADELPEGGQHPDV